MYIIIYNVCTCVQYITGLEYHREQAILELEPQWYIAFWVVAYNVYMYLQCVSTMCTCTYMYMYLHVYMYMRFMMVEFLEHTRCTHTNIAQLPYDTSTLYINT